MFKINFNLKLLIVLLTMIALAATFNYIILWSALILLLLIKFSIKNYKILFIDFLLIIFLILSYKFNIFMPIFKVGYFINMIYTFYLLLTDQEKLFIESLFKKSSEREIFYKENYEKIINRNRNKVESNYDVDIDIINEDVINNDLERLYLQSKIRYLGYKDKKENNIKFEWNSIDAIVLMVVTLLFVLSIIFR